MSNDIKLSNNDVPKFIYWKANSRALAPMLMLDAANIEYIWDDNTANTWPEPKNEMPFGQLPVLLHNDMKIAQSGTITRYCAMLAGLMSLNENENVVSDMVHEHCNDIFDDFGRAKYCPDISELKEKIGWNVVVSEKLPNKLNYLEKMLEGKKYFNGDQLQWGDICVFAMIELCNQGKMFHVFENYPNLKSHYARVSTYGNIQKYFKDKINPYFVAEL